MMSIMYIEPWVGDKIPRENIRNLEMNFFFRIRMGKILTFLYVYHNLFFMRAEREERGYKAR